MEPSSAVFSAAIWLIGAIVRSSATLKEWAEQVEFKVELESLNTEIANILATLNTNSEINVLHGVMDLAYRAQDLLDDLDYYRIQDEIEQTSGGNLVSAVPSPLSRGGIEEIKGIRSPSVSGDEDSITGSPSHGGGKKGSRLSASSIGRQTSNLFSKLIRSSSRKDVTDVYAHNGFPKSALAHRMKDLVEELKKVYKDIGNTRKSEVAGAISVSNLLMSPKKLMQTMTDAGKTIVLGRDQERDYLIELITGYESANCSLSVYSVVGIGGVGKTALTQLVYHDQRVKAHFELRMWVTVSSNFDVSRVVREMAQQVSDDSHVGRRSIDKLKNLRSKRFLLVVDGMKKEWESQWNSLMTLLKESSVQGNLILVTTEMQAVAKMIDSSESVHLYGLEDTDLWELFKLFTCDDEWFEKNRSLEIIGRQIVRKLKSNLLLVKIVGALLKRELDKTHWLRVLEVVKDLEGEGDVKPVLKRSFDNLPFNLQQCFSYSALFPKDYPLDRDEMVRLWIAQGFVDSEKERIIEDVGTEYFNSLVNQGFLQRIDKESPSSEWSEYHMHHSMHDSVLLPSTDSHIAIFGNYSEKELVKLKSMKPENLRTFFMEKDELKEPNVLKRITKAANGLRVLRLNATLNFQTLFNDITNLTHLRYLRLEHPLETLPEYICKLYHLEVLDISCCGELVSLPGNFNNLVKIRHFLAGKNVHSLIAGVGKLTSLQELSQFRVNAKSGFSEEQSGDLNELSDFSIDQLGDLKELRGSLSIYNLVNVRSKDEASNARLVDKEFLNSICLSWDGNDREDEKEVFDGLQPNVNLKSLHILGYGCSSTPSWLNNASLVNIESVSLQNCSGLESLPPLGELPFLKKLHLKSLPKVKEIGSQLYGSSKDGLIFQSLEEILIEDMTGLEMWNWTKETLLFPALKVLEIKKCPNLREIPLSTPDSLETEGNKRFPCLDTLVINNCHKLEKIPPLPHTHRLSCISIKGVIELFGELNLSVLRGELILHISSNHGLKSLDELLLFYNLRNLTSLRIKDCPNLISLGGEGIFTLVFLNNLRIEECIKLDSLPSDLTPLLSLEKLSIVGCKSVKSFPEDDLPDSLKELHVDNCSAELHEICERIKSVGKINIKLGGEMI
ncbi:hypothetical protein LUZ60_009068 [Juncus effusus]|nr:hypothetical protein LUZ60_009068 [Juncus effusus]